MIPAYTAASMQHNSLNVCLAIGQPQTFVCEVQKQLGSLPRLEWRIDFDHEDPHSVPTVTGQYTSADSEGHIIKEDRLGVNFVFNLTSNSPSSLVSVMAVTANDTNTTALITVNCAGDKAYPKVLHVNEGT